jgi:hypothetical protein
MQISIEVQIFPRLPNLCGSKSFVICSVKAISEVFTLNSFD